MRAIMACLLLALTGAAPPDAGEGTAIPAILAPYLTGGVVAPGDYRWLRGRFPGASPQDVEVLLAGLKLDEDCVARARTAMMDKLAAMGQRFDPGDESYARPAACRQFTQLPVGNGVSWEQVSAALDRVRPYALGLLTATRLAEEETLDHGDFADQLRTRTIGEQMLRKAWIESQRHGGETAGYSPLERSIHEAILLRALDDRDQANTQWLSRMVAAEGWPTRTAMGDDASRAAWLLAQHADADPAFQLRALQLMAPLVARGEVDQVSFAMLTDRVQMKLSGKQRYGTQWTCANGKRAPQPLEADATATDRARKQVGLDTLAENARRIDAMYGGCLPER